MIDRVNKLLGIEDESVRRVWLVLTGASALSSVAVLPYTFELIAPVMKAQGSADKLARQPPLPVIALAGGVQSGIMFGLVAALGLRAARSQGLGAPILEATLNGKPALLELRQVGAYAAAGAGGALLLAAVDHTVFADVQAAMRKKGIREPTPWKALLASTYGAIGEEVLMRLGLQSIVSAGVRRLRGEKQVPPGAATTWTAIAAANLLFGLGHLPTTRAIIDLTPKVVVRALLLNGALGALFGYLYWRRGLEAAVIAHGATDLVVHIVVPQVLRRRG